jgi:hypothetical protein
MPSVSHRCLALVAAAGLSLALATGAAGQQNYRVEGVSGFTQDLNPNDTFDPAVDLLGTWVAEFAVPAQASLTLLSNVQNQGGSLTRYNSVTLLSLVLNTPTGPLTIINAPTPARLTLWDRRSFRGGTDYFDLFVDLGATDVTISFSSSAGTPSTLGYNNLFTRGTPDPNTLDADGLPLALDPSEISATFLGAGLTVTGNAPIFPGPGNYFGNAERLFNPAVTPPALGSCCDGSGSCTVRIATNCTGGSVWTSGAVCDPNPCPQPTGACCEGVNMCVISTELDCNGVFQGPGTACDPQPCVPVTYTLTTAVIGSGSIVASPAGAGCPGACAGTYDENTEVTLTAVPAPGWRFTGWTGDVCDGTTDPCSVFMDSDYSQTATFACIADFNQDTQANIDDIFIFLNAWFAGCDGTQAAAPCNGRSADVNDLGGVNIDDIFIFLNFWFAGC